MKHILVINYSQSGQLDQILKNFLEPLKHNEHLEVEHVHVHPRRPFPFPWTGDAFWGAMPGCVLEDGMDIAPINLKRDDYDLIIFGYQVWFLSVSLPSMAILKNSGFKKVIKDTPVVTVIGARNMWLNAHERAKHHIAEAGGRLVANIPLIDRNTNLISVITIFYWMLSGKKERMWGIFPYPGVHSKDIEEAKRPGELVFQSLSNNDYNQLQQDIHNLGQINISSSILFMELRIKKIFLLWAQLIRRKGTTEKKFKFWTHLFKYYLLIALFLVSPIVLTVYNLLVLPFTLASVKSKKMYFYGINKT